MDDPFVNFLYGGAAGWLGWMFWQDLQAHRQGRPNPKALPGAVPCAPRVILWGALGALLILALETIGESALGVSDRQSTLPWHALFALLGAGVIEEVVFRGFLLVRDRGKAALYGSVFGFSTLFALIHFHWLSEVGEEGGGFFGYVLNLSPEALWWTFILWLNALWFYALRLLPANAERSLLPCIVAHMISNLGVFIVKLAQGYVAF
jgi:uncharacterized protein